MLDIHNRRWWQLGNLMAARPMTRDPLTIGELPPAPRALLGVMVNDLTHLILRQQLSPRARVTGLTARLTLLRVLASQLLGFLPRLRSTLLTRLRSISRRWRGAITRGRSRLLLDRAQPLLQPHQELHARLTPRVIHRLSLRPLHTNQVRRPANRTLLWKPRQLNAYPSRVSGVRVIGQSRGHHLHPGVDQRLVIDLGWDAEDVA